MSQISKFDFDEGVLVKGKGLEGITFILNYVNNVYFEERQFPEPMLIYRGVTGYYPRKENGIIVQGKKVIQSSLAYRLQEFYPEGYNRSTYISKLKQMVSEARSSFPKEYSNFSDLSILADIQHNGGATCLVDFSKNILKALWFACERDNKEDGYLYCYNIMQDSIINNNLTWIKNNDRRDIESLLTASSRFANVCSDVTNRFYYWTPPAVNNRIVNQDSIFIFGLDKFEIEKHQILMFRIPAETKDSIKKALESFFNIHSFSIYHDVPGYARSKARTTPVAQTDGVKNFNSVFIDIFEFIRNEDYTSATSLIRRYQGWSDYKKITPKEEMELHYSLAICFKKTSSKDRADYDVINAIEEFKKVISISNMIIIDEKKKLRGEHLSQKRNSIIDGLEYLSRKSVRAYNEIIDLCYESQRSWEGIQICDEIIKNAKNFHFDAEQELNLSVCRITRMELYIIYKLYRCCHKDIQTEDSTSTQFMEIESNSKEIITSSNKFDELLVNYYRLFNELIIDYVKDKGTKESHQKVKIFKKNFMPSEIDKYLSGNNYYYWDFIDILEAIGQLEQKGGKNSIPYINDMKELTSSIIAFRDILESQLMLRNSRM